MTKIELGTAVAVLTTVFAVGAGWSTINGRLDRLDEKLTTIEESQAEPLCLTVLTTQVRAVERGKKQVSDELMRLSEQFCPQPPSNSLDADFTSELSEAEKLKQIEQANDELARIISEVDKPL